jgi:hypothetical protein
MQFFMMLWEKNNQLYLFFTSYWIKNTISYPLLYVLDDKLSFNSILEREPKKNVEFSCNED